MPTKLGFGGVLIWDGGTFAPVEVSDFTDVTTTIKDDPPECINYIPNSWFRDEICGTFNISRTAHKTFMRMCYGWKAKGPMRIRVLRKLWKKGGML